MKKRLIVLHYTSWPKIGGMEISAEELTRAACKFKGWESVLISGTTISEQLKRKNDSSCFSRITIPEISTDHIENRKSFQKFRTGQDVPGIGKFSDKIFNELNKLILPKDLLISINCFSLPYNIALTSALWKLTIERDDFTHVTWSSDLAVTDEEFDWRRKKDWPWKLMWEICPRLIYTVSAKPVAESQSSILGLNQKDIDVIPAGISPNKIYKFSPELSKLMDKKALLLKFPLIFLPAKISSRKNIPKALSVIKYLKDILPNAHLIISGSYSPHNVGTQDMAKHLIDVIDKINLTDDVTILGLQKEYDGSVSYDDTMSVLASCDGVIFTSYREGFLIPVLEANLYNIPIFVPDDESILSWANNYVISYSRDDNPANISKLIADFYNKNEKLKTKYLVRSKYSWSYIAKSKFFKYIGEI